MIKKLSIGLISLGILIPCFSNAVNVVNDLGDYEDLGGNNNCTINSNYSFSCSESSNVIIGTDSSWYKSSTSYFRTTSGLATYLYFQNGSNVQGYVSSLLYCGENSNPLSSCNSKHNITYEEFLTYKDSNQLKFRMWYSDSSTLGYAGPAFIYDNSYILIAPSNGTSFFGTITPYNFNLVGYGLQANWAGVPVVAYPFGLPTYEDNNTTEVSDSDYIDYYESNPVLSFTPDMCYIGTRDLTSVYEDVIPYYQGTGYTIFEFYSHLYGNTYKLTDFESFLDVWSYNFDTFFNGYNRFADGTPKGVRYYSGIGNVGIQYSNLTNPFLNNLSAYYFMGSSICDNNSAYLCSDISEDIAVYCYKLLKPSGNITYNPSNSTNNNVGGWVANRDRTNYFNLSGDLLVDYSSRNGTPLDYFEGGDDFNNLNGYFSGGFNKFKHIFDGLDPTDLVVGQIPTYIVYFLLALILFRFLSR